MDPSRGSSMHRSGKSQLPIELADGAALDEVKSKTEANFRVALKNTFSTAAAASSPHPMFRLLEPQFHNLRFPARISVTWRT